MLVLTRTKGESVVIAGNTTVKVVGIRGNKVRLGIVAPKDVPVCRQELLDDSTSPSPHAVPATDK